MIRSIGALENDSQNALFLAATEGDLDGVVRAVLEGGEINFHNVFGWTALVKAAYNQHLEVVKWLINNGANVNYANQNGTSVLMYSKTKALGTGNFEVMDTLIKRGANVNHRDKKRGWTILGYVKEARDQEMADFLIKNGAVL